MLNSVHANHSIYNQYRLNAIKFFIVIIKESKQYWNFIVDNPTGNANFNEDIYRILGVKVLIDLSTIFEKSGMYEHAIEASTYIEIVYPYRGAMNKARVAERQGHFTSSIESMLGIYKTHKEGKLSLAKTTIIDLILNIGWAIVSGRIGEHKALGWELSKIITKLYKFLELIKSK